MSKRERMHSGIPRDAGLERNEFPAVKPLHAEHAGVAQLPPSAPLAVRLMGDAWKDIFQGSNHALGGPFIDAEHFGNFFHSDAAVPAGGHTRELQQVLCLLERHGAHPRQFLT